MVFCSICYPLWIHSRGPLVRSMGCKLIMFKWQKQGIIADKIRTNKCLETVKTQAAAAAEAVAAKKEDNGGLNVFPERKAKHTFTNEGEKKIERKYRSAIRKAFHPHLLTFDRPQRVSGRVLTMGKIALLSLSIIRKPTMMMMKIMMRDEQLRRRTKRNDCECKKTLNYSNAFPTQAIFSSPPPPLEANERGKTLHNLPGGWLGVPEV